MKKLKKSTFLVLMIAIIVGFSSCLVGLRHDNGRHRGYSKNTHLYHKKVYKPKHNKHRTYQTRPVIVVREHDNGNNHDNGNHGNNKKKHKSKSKR